MRVSASQRTTTGSATAGAQRAGGGARFEIGGAGGTGRADAAQTNPRIVSIGTVLALQAVDQPLSGRRRAVARGHDVLDLLDRLKLALLGGGIGEEDAERLKAASAAARADAAEAEPGLKDTLDAIDLRAQVELAKLAARDGRKRTERDLST